MSPWQLAFVKDCPMNLSSLVALLKSNVVVSIHILGNHFRVGSGPWWFWLRRRGRDPEIKPDYVIFARSHPNRIFAHRNWGKRLTSWKSINENNLLCSFVSVHNCIMEERRVHLHGGHQRYLLLLQWLLQPGRCGLRNLCKWLWCLLPV